MKPGAHRAILLAGAIAALLVSRSAPVVARVFQTGDRSEHDKAFWQAITKNEFVPPPPATVAQLAPELVTLLGSPDSELRDDLAATILTQWIYQKKLLGPDELRTMAGRLTANLREGIGQTGTDAVLRRSFSALLLSVIAARNNETPFLSPGEIDGLLDASLAYFRDERDVRGFDEQKGWMHSAAHTADLLKFLARSPTLVPAAQRRILDAVTDKLRQAPVAFAAGEDERIARIPISIVRRDDVDREAFGSWLDSMARLAAFPEQPSVAALRSMTNARHVLSALWTELSVDRRPSAGADFARRALEERLGKLF